MAQYDPLNLKVHHKNPKSGRTERVTPYRLHIDGRVRMFEMPAGSGSFFFENGEPVPAEKAPKLSPYQLPLTEEELRAKHRQELADAQAKAERLEAELAAFKAPKTDTPKIVSKFEK